MNTCLNLVGGDRWLAMQPHPPKHRNFASVKCQILIINLLVGFRPVEALQNSRENPDRSAGRNYRTIKQNDQSGSVYFARSWFG